MDDQCKAQIHIFDDLNPAAYFQTSANSHKSYLMK